MSVSDQQKLYFSLNKWYYIKYNSYNWLTKVTWYMVPKFNILNWTYLGYYTNISRDIAISIAIQLATLILLVQYVCRISSTINGWMAGMAGTPADKNINVSGPSIWYIVRKCLFCCMLWNMNHGNVSWNESLSSNRMQ